MFLKNNEEIIQGDVLEIEDNTYTRQFGGSKVSKYAYNGCKQQG